MPNNVVRIAGRNVVGDQLLRSSTQPDGSDIQHMLVADSAGNIVGVSGGGLRTAGEVDHDAVNTLPTQQFGGHATDPRTGQNPVAVGDRVRAAFDTRGHLIVRAHSSIMYSSLFRLANRPYPLAFTFAANTRKQFAAIAHAAGATKALRLRRVAISVRSISIAAILTVDLVRITTLPATSNPVITSTPHDSSDPNPESTSFALPTTAGTEFAGSAISSLQYETAAVTPAVTSAAPPVLTTSWQTLYKTDLSDLDDAPSIPPGVAGGFAVVLDCNAAAAVTATVEMDFSEV